MKKYLPKSRTDYAPSKEDLKSESKTGDTFANLPNPTKDPIACNNIACQEFDYTEDPLFEEDKK